MSSESNECSICMEVSKFSSVKTHCGHTFCFECYSKHVNSGQNYSHKCPCCRKAISEVGDNLINREEYLRSLPAHEPTTQLNNDLWEVFPSEDNNTSVSPDNNTSISPNNTTRVLLNALQLVQSIRNSNRQETTLHAQNIRNSNQTLNVSQPIRYDSDNIPFRPRVLISSSSVRMPAPSNVSRIKPPKYDRYPGYQGCWNNNGHPDKRTKEWHEWERQNVNETIE